MGARAKWLIWLVVVAVPLGFLAWDIADLFADPKSEREVMGENFLEDDLYAGAVDEVIAAHGREATLLDVYVDLRSAQFSIATGPRKAVVEGFGNRGGGEAYTGGSPVKDYERRIYDGELDAAMRSGSSCPTRPGMSWTGCAPKTSASTTSSRCDSSVAPGRCWYERVRTPTPPDASALHLTAGS